MRHLIGFYRGPMYGNIPYFITQNPILRNHVISSHSTTPAYSMHVSVLRETLTDLHHFYADPDPAFHLKTDPDPAPHLSGICDHWSTDPPQLHVEPLRLLFNFDFNADPDPAFYPNADSDSQPCF